MLLSIPAPEFYTRTIRRFGRLRDNNTVRCYNSGKGDVMSRRTTEETMRYIKRQTRYIKANETREGLTKAQWAEMYSQFEEVINTLSFVELKLLFLTRQCPIGTAFKFMKAAEKIIDANKAMTELTERP